MSEGLENFMRNRRKQFDELEAPENLWDNINTNLDNLQKAKKAAVLKKQFNILFRIAAVLVLFVSSGLLFLMYQKSKPTNISGINAKLANEQVHYASMIKTRKTELEEVKHQEPKLYREFATELNRLDRTYKRLKSDLVTSPNQEQTLKAMVLNLQIQAQVLSQQLIILQQIMQLKNDQKNENHNQSI